MFTKGEWKAVEDDFGFHIQSEQSIVGGFHEDADIEIADINQYLDNEDEPKANAQLIASAPDLYEALKGAGADLERCGLTTFRIDSALAKAEGKNEVDRNEEGSCYE